MLDAVAYTRLRAELPEGRVSALEVDRRAYAGDMWPRLQVAKLRGEVCAARPDAVVWPESTEEIAQTLRICDELRVPVVPFGAGSGVCGGALPDRGGVTVDMRRMAAIERIDEGDLLVVAQCGIIGHHLERALNERHLTLGHFPSSILCSTLGGWIAARSAGQCSSRYGKIEDMVLGLEVVLASGEVLHTGPLGLGAALDLTPLFIGSEGTLGVVTRALLRVHPYPPARAMRGYRFRDLDRAVEAMRCVMVDGLQPAVLRLYDATDTLLAGGAKGSASEAPEGLARRVLRAVTPAALHEVRRRLEGFAERAQGRALHTVLAQAAWVNRFGTALSGGCKLITGLEGEREEVLEAAERLARIMDECGGDDLGEEPGLAWLERRYEVSFKQMKVYAAGAFVDTMEVATSWSRLVEVYDRVRAALSPHVVVMAHFSHAYPEGCSIYFTFAGAGADADATAALYDRAWSVALEAVVQAGACVSHHHGVGLAKRGALARTTGDARHVFYAAKQQLDPNGIMNPGKVFADPVDPPMAHAADGGDA